MRTLLLVLIMVLFVNGNDIVIDDTITKPVIKLNIITLDPNIEDSKTIQTFPDMLSKIFQADTNFNSYEFTSDSIIGKSLLAQEESLQPVFKESIPLGEISKPTIQLDCLVSIENKRYEITITGFDVSKAVYVRRNYKEIQRKINREIKDIPIEEITEKRSNTHYETKKEQAKTTNYTKSEPIKSVDDKEKQPTAKTSLDNKSRLFSLGLGYQREQSDKMYVGNGFSLNYKFSAHNPNYPKRMGVIFSNSFNFVFNEMTNDINSMIELPKEFEGSVITPRSFNTMFGFGYRFFTIDAGFGYNRITHNGDVYSKIDGTQQSVSLGCTLIFGPINVNSNVKVMKDMIGDPIVWSAGAAWDFIIARHN